jgi:hypothetical protein
MYVVDDSVLDGLVNTVTLKFIFLVVALFGLLNHGPMGISSLEASAAFATWAVVGVSVFIWYLTALSFAQWLWRKRYIRFVFTPLISLPGLPLYILVIYSVVSVIGDDTHFDRHKIIRVVVSDLFAIMLLDVFFAAFVAPNHPSFSRLPFSSGTPVPDLHHSLIDGAEGVSKYRIETEPGVPSILVSDILDGRSDIETAPDVTEEVKELECADDGRQGAKAIPEADEIIFGKDAFQRSEIGLVQSEDHYLTIVTLSGRRAMVRGEMKRFASEMDIVLGYQISRSNWVAFSFIEVVRLGNRGQLEILLKSGEIVVVSRSRRQGFRELFERLGYSAIHGRVNF